MDNCDGSESDELRSNIYSFCIQMQKSGNNSPYLLATIMDLDKEDGLREKDTVKLKNAMEVNPFLRFNTLNKSLLKVWKIALISCCYSHLKCNTNPRVAILFLNVSNYSIKENKWESLYLQITQGLRFPENAIKMDHNWEAIQGYVRIPSRMWRRIRISLCIQRS